MRGNFACLGRQDYVEPKPIAVSERAMVDSCKVVARVGSRFWSDVYCCGVLLGGVAIYMCGQVYRPNGIEAGEYLFAAKDWSRSDPTFASAILCLLRHELSADLLLNAHREEARQ